MNETLLSIIILSYLLAGAVAAAVLIYGTDESEIPPEYRLSLYDTLMIIIFWPFILFYFYYQSKKDE